MNPRCYSRMASNAAAMSSSAFPEPLEMSERWIMLPNTSFHAFPTLVLSQMESNDMSSRICQAQCPPHLSTSILKLRRLH